MPPSMIALLKLEFMEEYEIIDFFNMMGGNEVKFRKTVGLPAGLRIILKNGRFIVE